MKQAAENLDFETAIQMRDEIEKMKREVKTAKPKRRK
jgi:excinuclease UvrABC helicase subunit UvrB